MRLLSSITTDRYKEKPTKSYIRPIFNQIMMRIDY